MDTNWLRISIKDNWSFKEKGFPYYVTAFIFIITVQYFLRDWQARALSAGVPERFACCDDRHRDVPRSTASVGMSRTGYFASNLITRLSGNYPIHYTQVFYTNVKDNSRKDKRQFNTKIAGKHSRHCCNTHTHAIPNRITYANYSSLWTICFGQCFLLVVAVVENDCQHQRASNKHETKLIKANNAKFRLGKCIGTHTHKKTKCQWRDHLLPIAKVQRWPNKPKHPTVQTTRTPLITARTPLSPRPHFQRQKIQVFAIFEVVSNCSTQFLGCYLISFERRVS